MILDSGMAGKRVRASGPGGGYGVEALPTSPAAFAFHFLRTQKLRLAGAILSGLCTILASVCLMAISAYLIERASQRPPILSLMVAITSVRFFGISRGVFRYLDRYLSHDASFGLLGGIRAGVYERLIPLVPGGLRTAGQGEVLSRAVADVDTLQEWFVRGFVPSMVSLLTSAFVVVAATVILPTAGLAILLGLLVATAVIFALAWSSRSLADRELWLRGRLVDGTVSHLRGAADLFAFGAAKAEARKVMDMVEGRDRVLDARARRTAITTALQVALPGLLAAAVGAVAIGALEAGHGGLNPLAVGVLVLGIMAGVETMAALPAAIESWQRGRAAVARLTELTSLPPPVKLRATAPMAAPPARAFRLSVRGLRFSYGESAPVLDGLDLDLRRGDRIVISGRSGSGKTTLANLLLRFLQPAAGSITVDGVDLQTISEVDLRRLIGAATQDAHIFAGSIAANIRVGKNDATDEEVWAALHDAQIDGWVRSLPDGLDTQAGERGATLSGGQRRRIALARSFLAGFPFLVADEPTEGLDGETGRALMETLFDPSRDYGLLVITHRPDLCPPGARYLTLPLRSAANPAGQSE